MTVTYPGRAGPVWIVSLHPPQHRAAVTPSSQPALPMEGRWDRSLVECPAVVGPLWDGAVGLRCAPLPPLTASWEKKDCSHIQRRAAEQLNRSRIMLGVENHRMIGLEETLRIIKLQPCAVGWLPPAGQAAQSPIHSGFGDLQGWGTHASLGSSVRASSPSVQRISFSHPTLLSPHLV